MQSRTVLLQLVLYLTPFAAIIWYTLNERLPVYQRTYFPEDQEFIYQQRTSHLSSNPFATITGYIGSFIKNTMSTRYWDEIDWYIQEGTQKLCQMLQEENDDASSKWSAGEGEKDATAVAKDEEQADSSNEASQDLSKDMENFKIEDHGSDEDSEKDEGDYIERSTSVEDKERGAVKKQAAVEELLQLCNEVGLAPPVYTYFSLDDSQIVATIQLWNGMRLSCSPQKTKDKAMEDVASQGLAVLKSEIQDTRPTSTSPQYVTLHNMAPTQYFPAHPAYASPLSYTTAPPQAYYYHTSPYMVPSRSVVPLASDNQHQHPALMHPHIRYGPQYAQYLPHYPYVTAQVSPTHQAKRPYHQAAAGMPPVMWNYYPRDYSQKDNIHRPKTEFKLLDKPPVPKDNEEKHGRTAESSNPAGKNVSNTVSGKNNDDGMKSRTSNVRKQENQSKAKLAISFKQGKN